jgi:hypothetical protein
MDHAPIRYSGGSGVKRNVDVMKIQKNSMARVDGFEYRFFDGE